MNYNYESIKQRVLESVSIVDVINDYVPLKRKGRDYECNCPFHEEKTGSFKVSEEKKLFKCFGCGKAGNAIDFVMESEGLTFFEALKKVATKGGIVLDESVNVREPRAKMTKVPGQDKFSYEKKPFTSTELRVLGRYVTEDICEKQFSLYSVAYYITPVNDKGDSWKIESEPDYPIFVYDYGEWGKIYQPLSKDFRFSYFGEKPENSISGDAKTMRLIQESRKGNLPEPDSRLEELIIVSGGSDALNTYAAGYHVCFLNSETAELSDYDFNRVLSPIARSIYVLYDLDRTGIKSAYNLALRFIDRLKIIYLPEDLPTFKDRKGKPCKDVKDFFNHYRNPKRPNLQYYFRQLVRSSLTLCFWSEKTDKEGELTGYEINNEQLYGFLSAQGIYTLANEQSKRKFCYVEINQNVVDIIDDEEIQSHVNRVLISYLRENLQYHNISLINAVHRSPQVKVTSLEKIRRTELDFRSFGNSFDYLFFKNTAVKVTPTGIEPISLEQVGKYVYSNKIQDFHFRKLDAPFEINYTKEYLDAKIAFESCPASSPNYRDLKIAYEKFSPTGKFKLELKDPDFVITKYIYNTGRTYWKKEESGLPLTAKEKAEHDLHFISKVAALGYLMYRFKEKSRGYMVYGLETELSEVGDHQGGTGKSMFFKLLESVRTVYERDGQAVKRDDDESAFAGVKKGFTDIIYFDDLNKDVDLHRFMPMATSRMAVRNLYENKVIIEFEDSPKIGFTSNHPIGKFDASLRRRSWFVGFCDYYHSENPSIGVQERSPRTEFGKNIPEDFTTEEMNKLYNFLAYCLQTYLKFRIRINPPMEAIERRTIQRMITDEFIWWADDFFTPERLNTPVNKNEIFESWKDTLSDAAAKTVRASTLKTRLMQYCLYKGYQFCPDEVLQTQSERERREIRKKVDYKDEYFYYLQTPNKGQEDDLNYYAD